LAAVLLKPTYNWQQMMERFGDQNKHTKSLRQLRYLFGLEKEI